MDLTAPLINDITTDFNDPPELFRVKRGALSELVLPYPDYFTPKQAESYPDIHTRRYEIEKDLAYRTFRQVLLDFARVVLVREEEKEQDYIQAIFTTPLLRFNDDVSVRFSSEENSVAVDIRSRSRLGRGDLGANAQRIRKLYELFEDAIDVKKFCN